MNSAILNWDSDEWRALRNEKLLVWMCGKQEAVDVVVALSTIAETWDDLYDADKSVAKDRLNQAFVLMLVKLQTNEFYKSNEALFYALTVTAINAWMDANELQGSNLNSERMMAFYLRNFGIEIAMLAAFRCGGFDHLRKVSLGIRKFFAHEDFAGWDANHG